MSKIIVCQTLYLHAISLTTGRPQEQSVTKRPIGLGAKKKAHAFLTVAIAKIGPLISSLPVLKQLQSIGELNEWAGQPRGY